MIGSDLPGSTRLQPGSSIETEPGPPEKNDLHLGWYSRGYLPHLDPAHIIQHVTYHLADSLPALALARLTEELEHVPAKRQGVERRKRIEALLKAGHGGCLLHDPVAAQLVQDAFLFFDGVRYRLLDWVAMPNQVHVLFEPLEGWSLARIVGSWKSFTGRRLAPMLQRRVGAASVRRVWQREYWDRFMRNEQHMMAAQEYDRSNPVKAGLVMRPEEWRWSSAATRADGESA